MSLSSLQIVVSDALRHRREAAHAALRAHVLDAQFPCVGARSAFNRGRYRTGLFAPLGTEGAAAGLCRALGAFGAEFGREQTEPASFVAMFADSGHTTEEAFEQALWQQLQRMHAIDAAHHPWDPHVSADPADANFSFSIGGRAYFVVGLHPAASRLARRTAQPTLVFNLHDQFERLRASGKYAGLQKVTRQRDVALQGSLNPVLANHGHASEARQYAGRDVGADWQCPFRQEAA